MHRKSAALGIALLLLVLAPGCQRVKNGDYSAYDRYTDSFVDTFDTLVQVVAYTQSEDEFAAYMQRIHTRFQELHRLYDRYNSYAGVNNIKTINDSAGSKPVKVAQEIIDLLLFAKTWYGRTAGRTNIALGPVLEIWHRYRTEGIDRPDEAALPPMEALRAAAALADIDRVIVDRQAGTVFLAEEGMSLDVGAMAKGFATEIVAKEMIDAGMNSGVISAGGNVRAIGVPLDGVRERWGIGIHDPDASIFSGHEELLDIVFVGDAAVVSSGDYQRYYTVGGRRYHHLIDPDTLMPANHYRAVTVITDHAGVADLMSTELFLLPFEQSSALAEDVDQLEAIWVMPDGEVRVTGGLKAMLKSFGATNQKQ